MPLSDKPTIKCTDDLIEISHGRRFPLKKWYPIYLVLTLIIFALFFTSEGKLLSFSLIVFFILFIITLFSSFSGIVINLIDKEFNFFSEILFMRFGKWRKYIGFSCLVIKTTSKSKEGLSYLKSESIYNNFHKLQSSELYIMDANHRRKILCGSFDTFQEAKDFAKEVSELLNYPIEKFNPKRATRR
ncbi:MAG: hypothetical protein ACPGVD_10185 [Flavobacteriales bacterium]